MFVNVARTLRGLATASAQTMGVLALMKRYNVRSFRDGFHKRMFEAAAKGRGRRYHRVYHAPGKAEAKRRRLTGAHWQQLNSHKPGTLQPRHIFGASA